MKAKTVAIFIIVLCVILSCQGFSGKGLSDLGIGVSKSQSPDVDDYGQEPKVSPVSPTSSAAVARAVRATVEEITPQNEYIIGQAVTAKILESYKIWNEKPNLTEYLNRICLSLAVKSPKPDIFNGYIVSILDSNEAKAFAIPGGHIYLTRGLVNTAKSEDDLALIIAREIAHLQLQHAIKTNEAVDEIVLNLLTKGYPREQELAAENHAKALLDTLNKKEETGMASSHRRDLEKEIKEERFTAAMR